MRPNLQTLDRATVVRNATALQLAILQAPPGLHFEREEELGLPALENRKNPTQAFLELNACAGRPAQGDVTDRRFDRTLPDHPDRR